MYTVLLCRLTSAMDVIGSFVILIAVGFFVGSYIEKKHLQDLHDREYRTRQIKLINIGAKTPLAEAERTKLFVRTEDRRVRKECK